MNSRINQKDKPVPLPHHVMNVSLLHKCNFNCDHCGYIYIGDSEDHVIHPGYKLTWDEVGVAIGDCVAVNHVKWYLNFTGGEPTLWKDEGKDLMDILIKVAKSGVLPGYNTNGSYFYNYDRSLDFFRRYLASCDVPLKTYISMDKFHNNYDHEAGRAKSLDTIVKVLDVLPSEKKHLVETHVITIFTKDEDSKLPEEMKSYYEPFGIHFGEFPLMPIGKAKAIADQQPFAPDLSHMRSDDETKGPPVVVMVGDDYYQGNAKIGKRGHLIDLYPELRQSEPLKN